MDDQSKSQPTIAPLLLRVDEAARLLSLGRSTVYELLASGALPVVKIGTVRRIPLAGLQDWVARQTTNGGA